MKRLVLKKLVPLFLAVVLTWALASVAGAQVLKPLEDGFPKRAITIINIDDPGTRDGIWARMLQTACRGISPVPILVSDEPVATGGTWMKVHELLTRVGALEGYYPMVISGFGVPTDLSVEPRTREINAKLTDMKMILNTDSLPFIFIQRKNAPWGKGFTNWVKYAQEHPGELKYVSLEVGSGHDIATSMIMAKYGIKVKKIPQGTDQDIASTIGAGMGDFGMVMVDVALIHWQAGRVDVALVTADTVPPPWDKDPTISSSKDLGIPSWTGALMGLGVNSQVPQSHIDWLYNMFKAASEKPEFTKRWEGLIPGDMSTPMTGPEADKLMQVMYDTCDPVIRAVGLHIDQQK